MLSIWGRTLESLSQQKLVYIFFLKKTLLWSEWLKTCRFGVSRTPGCPWVCSGVLVPGGPALYSLCSCARSGSSRCTWLCWWWLGPSRLLALSSAAAFFSCLLLLPACPLITSLLSWDQHAHTQWNNKHTPADTLTLCCRATVSLTLTIINRTAVLQREQR